MRSMINLGLERTTRLLQLLAQRNHQSQFQPSWKTIHIAGTNGKGSVAAYLSALLRRAGSEKPGGREVRIGRFTSPHFIDRWDCIVINDRPVAEDVFKRTEFEVSNLAKQVEKELLDEARRTTETQYQSNNSTITNDGLSEQILRDARPTNFEILTATTFVIFSQPDPIPCDIAVIECGLGGRLDSTNVLPTSAIAVSVITRIGLDHLDMLGGSLRSIVREKCGILRREVPVVIDGDNSDDVLAMIRDEVHEKFGAKWEHDMVYYVHNTDLGSFSSSSGEDKLSEKHAGKSSHPRLENLLPHQQTNLAMAIKAFSLFRPHPDQTFQSSPDTTHQLSPSQLEAALLDASASYPARLQLLQPGWLNETSQNDKIHHNLPVLNTFPVLLDGAHNEQSAVVLRTFVERETIRSGTTRPTIWILAMSSTKQPIDILRTLFIDNSSSSNTTNTTTTTKPDHTASATSQSEPNSQSTQSQQQPPPNPTSIIFTQFSPPDSMPWVHPASNEKLTSAASSLGLSPNILDTTGNILEALDLVESMLLRLRTGGGKDGDDDGRQGEREQEPLVVVAGSLYLASDFLRFVRDGREGFLRHVGMRSGRET